MSGLPPIINAFLSVLAVVLGAFIGKRAHRREPISDASKVLKHSPHLWVVLVLPLLLMGFHTAFDLNPAWEWHLPYFVQYYYGPAAWGLVLSCFTYFAGFGGAVFLTTVHPRRLHLGAFMALLFLGLQVMHFTATQRPSLPQLGPPRTTQSGLVRQSNRSTCVPAAAASLLAILNDPRTEAELVELFGTQADGTFPSQLVRGMYRLGYTERTVSIERDGIDAVHPPAVLFVQNRKHAMTLLQNRGRRIDVWDPESGKVLLLERKQFDYLARGGYAIEFISMNSN